MDLKQVLAGTGQTPAEQNLIAQHKISTRERPPGFYKSIILDALSVIFAALFSGSYYWYLTKGLSIWVLFTALMLFAVVSVIQIFLAKNNIRRFFVIILESVALISFFWQDDSRILVTTIIILLATLSWAYFSGHGRLRNSIEIPFFSATNTALGKFTTGALLFMILIYVPQINGNALIISQKNFGTFFDWAAGTIHSFYPELQLTGNFGDFAQSFSTMELQNNPNFTSLNSSQQSAAIQQASTQFATGFLQNTSTTLASSTPTSDAFYNVLNGMLSGWQNQNSGWFDVGWVTVLFFGLRTLGILFVWAGQFMSLVVYEILLASGFMKVTEETHRKEIVAY